MPDLVLRNEGFQDAVDALNTAGVKLDGIEAGANLYAPDLFHVVKSGDQALTASYADITTWATPAIVDAGSFSFVAATGILTINKTAWYDISAYARIDITATPQSNTALVKLQEDIGPGYVDVAGTEVGAGVLNAAGVTSNTCSFQILRNMASGSKLKLRAIRSNGTGTIKVMAAGTGFTVLEVK